MNCTARDGGLVIAEGTPQAGSHARLSFTGDFLRPVLGLTALAAD